MTVNFDIRHELPMSVERFWAEIFRSEEFNRALYIEHMGCGYELEVWDPATGERRARVWPNKNVPQALIPLIGDKLGFVEEGTCDDDAERYDFRVVPSSFSERIRVGGTVVTRPLSEQTCERTVTFEIEARMFGIGRLVENLLESGTRDSYDKNLSFIKAYFAARP